MRNFKMSVGSSVWFGCTKTIIFKCILWNETIRVCHTSYTKIINGLFSRIFIQNANERRSAHNTFFVVPFCCVRNTWLREMHILRKIYCNYFLDLHDFNMGTVHIRFWSIQKTKNLKYAVYTVLNIKLAVNDHCSLFECRFIRVTVQSS